MSIGWRLDRMYDMSYCGELFFSWFCKHYKNSNATHFGVREHSVQVLRIQKFDENLKVDLFFRGISTLGNEAQGKDNITTFAFNREFYRVFQFNCWQYFLNSIHIKVLPQPSHDTLIELASNLCSDIFRVPQYPSSGWNRITEIIQKWLTNSQNLASKYIE